MHAIAYAKKSCAGVGAAEGARCLLVALRAIMAGPGYMARGCDAAAALITSRQDRVALLCASRPFSIGVQLIKFAATCPAAYSFGC